MTNGGQHVLNLFPANMQVSSVAAEGDITEVHSLQTSCLMGPML